MYSLFLKRFIDIIFSGFLISILLPVIVLIGFVLGINNRGNPFFTQKRPGLNGKLFRLVKFKTMTDEVDDQGQILPDEDRLKGLGKIIRKFSMDEIPQLWNVLIGDMSLVGPRPLLEEYLPLYSKEQAKRHLVRPGITGLAQVNGRNAISWEKKFEYDLVYVNNLSLKMDSKILILTFFKFLRPEGIHQEGHVTMPKFKGKKDQDLI
ncbi:sugar transferase [Aquiflexum sp. LQ15W]|uniref:sugar transferase n=1 Tax=Cognataquiflexum nitidum TaxID=2922272 RepID=UPI001F139AC5|nr:sugar transferase [Cognataquiflexum nitidum]MCH6198342.1 sugar transferase [Cognataquiflexum nitidum]